MGRKGGGRFEAVKVCVERSLLYASKQRRKNPLTAQTHIDKNCASLAVLFRQARESLTVANPRGKDAEKEGGEIRGKKKRKQFSRDFYGAGGIIY